MVESQPSKLLVAGSIPVSRSNLRSPRELRLASQVSDSADLSAGAWSAKADVAQLAERVLGKDEVSSSILDIGSSPSLARAAQRERRLASHAKGRRAVVARVRGTK